MDPALQLLTDDQLIDLGAALETELAVLRAAHAAMTTSAANAAGSALLKPGIKLGINSVVAFAGFVLAPVTLNLSLFFTVIGSGMTVWDGVDFGRDAGHLLGLRLQSRRRRRRTDEIAAQLRDIATILTRRVSAP